MTTYIQNSASTASAQLQRAASNATDAASAVARNLNDIVDRRIIAPERRSEMYGNAKGWAEGNPRLAAFIALQLALAGPPILIFVGFSSSVLLSRLVTCVVTALIVSLSFTALCIGGALLILTPVVVVATTTATFIFVCGLIGSVILQRLNESETPIPTIAGISEGAKDLLRRARGSSAPAEDGKISASGITESKANGLKPPLTNGTPQAANQKIS